MPFDLTTFASGAAIGTAVWELLKHLASGAVKRHGEKAGTRRKALMDDLTAADRKVHECLNDAFGYFTAAGDRIERSNRVRHSIRTLGMAFNSVNQALSLLGHTPIPAHRLIDFRQAITMELDNANIGRLDACDPMIIAMYAPAYQLSKELNSRRYNDAV